MLFQAEERQKFWDVVRVSSNFLEGYTPKKLDTQALERLNRSAGREEID